MSEKPVGHHGNYSDGVVTCSWCRAETPTSKTPPLSIVCVGCRRYVRAELIAERLEGAK